MAKVDKRIEAYIDSARDFAKPILIYIRSAVHKACPQVTETIKWGMPHFEYEGKILCGMAAFKKHCAFMFRLGSLMKDPEGIMERAGGKTGMGRFGQIMDVKNLPSQKVLRQYITEAMTLTDKGAVPPKTKAPSKNLAVPDDFLRILKKNKGAYTNFEKFSYSHKKEYVEWITEAKTTETRNKRMATAVEWLDKGKGRNWKYAK